MMLFTVLIIEDHNSLRRSLKSWLQTIFPECYIIEVANKTEALIISQTIRSHLVLIDVETSDERDSLNTITEIQRAIPDASVVVLTSFPETFQVSPLARVNACISKQRILPELQTVLTELLYPHKSEVELKI